MDMEKTVEEKAQVIDSGKGREVHEIQKTNTKWVNNIIIADSAIEKEMQVKKDEKGNILYTDKGYPQQEAVRVPVFEADGKTPVINKRGEFAGMQKTEPKRRTFTYKVQGKDAEGNVVEKEVSPRITIVIDQGDKKNHRNGKMTAIVPESYLKPLSEAKFQARSEYRQKNHLKYQKEWSLSVPLNKTIPVTRLEVAEDGKTAKLLYGTMDALEFKRACSLEFDMDPKARTSASRTVKWVSNGKYKEITFKGPQNLEKGAELDNNVVSKKREANTQSM
jgi:hypothetical protein